MSKRGPAQTVAHVTGAVALHTAGVATIATLLAVAVVGTSGVESILHAVGTPGDPVKGDPLSTALHVGISACVWALGCIAVAWIRSHRNQTRRVVKSARGTILTEFLIILVPFLLLTSGLAQLAILNIAGLLSHVAVYESCRTAWVWYPEVDRPGNATGAGEVQDRARIAAAMVLAPTAPSGFTGSTGGSAALMNNVGTMQAWMEPGYVRGSASGGVAGGGRADSLGRNQSYVRSFDIASFRERAGRKLAFTYNALTPFSAVQGGGRVTVAMTYNMNMVFPWFAYIWGTQQTIAGRTGYYSGIQRTMSLEEQVGFR